MNSIKKTIKNFKLGLTNLTNQREKVKREKAKFKREIFGEITNTSKALIITYPRWKTSRGLVFLFRFIRVKIKAKSPTGERIEIK